jgi:glycosyltransferase involved in cell wall biosynthesis
MDPLVSIVVPCYNYGHFLPKCIDSLLAQTYENVEILAIDNCSTDNTREVIGSYHDARLTYIRNESNIGCIPNFNKGVSLSRGKYIMVVPADDYFVKPNLLGRFVELMERHSEVGYVFCPVVDAQDRLQSFSDCGKKDKIWNGRSFLKRHLIKSNCIVLSSVMVRRECYEQISLFPEELPFTNDWYLWSVFALHHAVGYIRDPMVFFRTHEQSVTSALLRSQDGVWTKNRMEILWRVARLSEDLGGRSLRPACTASIANYAAQGLTSQYPGVMLGEAAVTALIRENSRDPADAGRVLATTRVAVGDRLMSESEVSAAISAYRLALKEYPWWPRVWGKYLLARMGRAGLLVRRVRWWMRERTQT